MLFPLCLDNTLGNRHLCILPQLNEKCSFWVSIDLRIFYSGWVISLLLNEKEKKKNPHTHRDRKTETELLGLVDNFRAIVVANISWLYHRAASTSQWWIDRSDVAPTSFSDLTH